MSNYVKKYKVVNKFLKEIRDIEVQSLYNSGALTISHPIQCNYMEYLDLSNLVDSVQLSLSEQSGHLRNFIDKGFVEIVYFNEETKEEISKEEYEKKFQGKIEEQPKDISLNDFLKSMNMSLEDFKYSLQMAKKQKEQEEKPVETNNINFSSLTYTDKVKYIRSSVSIDNLKRILKFENVVPSIQKLIEKRIQQLNEGN